MNTTLLPNGLTDLLFDEAEREAEAVHALMQFFKSKEYRRVKPPLIEFEESLLSGPGQSMGVHMFRLMDPISQKMMGVRADMTPQIARIAASRFEKSAYPLRLSYCGDVLHVKGSQLNPTRQFTQVGCELIGVDSIESDVESMMTAIQGLKEMGINTLTLDMTLPALMRDILGADADPALMKALDHKNKEDITALGGEYADMLLALINLSGDTKDSAAALEAINASKKAMRDIRRLKEVITALQARFKAENIDDVDITIEPTRRSLFDYYRGVSYALYAKGSHDPIARGGRYDFECDGGSETAIGFTIYMNALREI